MYDIMQEITIRIKHYTKTSEEEVDFSILKKNKNKKLSTSYGNKILENNINKGKLIVMFQTLNCMLLNKNVP